MSSSYRSNRLGLSHWDPYTVRSGGCLELYYCNIVTWWSGSGGIQAGSRRPTGFLQCFDTVHLVIWPVKIVPEMTYNLLSGTLSLYTTTTSWKFKCNHQFNTEQRSIVLAGHHCVVALGTPVCLSSSSIIWYQPRGVISGWDSNGSLPPGLWLSHLRLTAK